MVKLYIFDIGGVLIDFDFGIALRRLQKSGPVDPEKFYSLFRNSSLATNWDKGILRSREFFEIVQRELNLTIVMEEFKSIWNEIFSEKNNMVQLALSLRKHHTVILLSNTNPWHLEYLKKNFPWVEYFADFIASCDFHMLKPDPAFFRLVMKKARAQPSETFFIDDNLENVNAARKLGIDSVLFTNYHGLIEKMKL